MDFLDYFFRKLTKAVRFILVTGRGFNNLTSVYLARHMPTGSQVAVRITDLEHCSEDHLKVLQVKE